MNDSLNNKWLSISDVADLTGLRPSSLRYWARNGVFKRHGVLTRKFMGQWRVEASSLYAFIRSWDCVRWMKSAMVHGVAVHISYRSVSGGARCFLSSLVRRSRLSAPTEPFQASLKNAYPCRVAGTLWRRFLWVMWLACSLVRVRWNISAFAVCSWCSWCSPKSLERGGGTTARTEWRNDIPSWFLRDFGVWCKHFFVDWNIYIIVEIFTLHHYFLKWCNNA